MRNPRWTARLACDPAAGVFHDVPTQGEPKPGGWMSCLTPGCWRQSRIVAAVELDLAGQPARPGPARQVQGVLFELGEAA